MIDPGAKSAIKKTTTGKIGVIGTETTITNKAYSKALLNLDSKVQVIEKACPLFVPLAEEGWIEHPATKLIAKRIFGETKNRKY